MSFNSEDIKIVLERIDSDLRQLESNLANGQDIIKQHCTKLREHENLTQSLLDEIKNYESETVEKFLKSNSDKLRSKLDNMRGQLERLTQDSSNNNLAERTYDSLIDMQSKLAVEKENINAFIFGDALLEFKRGKLEVSRFYSIDFNKLDKLDLSKAFQSIKQKYQETYKDGQVYSNVIGLSALNNGNLVVVGCFHDNTANGNLNVFLFDQNKTVSKTVEIKNAFAGDMLIHDDKIALMYYTINKKTLLRVFDVELNLMQEVETDKRGLVGVDESFIYITPNNSNEPLITYDWKLNLVQQQKLNCLKFKNDIFDLKCNNGKYYFIECDEDKFYMKIIKQSTNELVKSMSVKSNSSLFINANNNILIYDGMKLVYMSSLGEVVNLVKLIDFPDTDLSKWTLDSNSNLFILDEENFILTFKIQT